MRRKFVESNIFIKKTKFTVKIRKYFAKNKFAKIRKLLLSGRFWFIFTLCIGIILRIVLFVFLDNPYYNTDAYTHIILSVEAYNTGDYISIFKSGGPWLPLRQLLFGGYFRFFNNDIISARFLSLIFGFLTFIPFYFLVKRFFDIEIARLSTVTLMFLGLHVKQSYISNTDVITIFLLLSAIYLISVLRKHFSYWRYCLAIACLIIGSMLRYEIWFFNVIIFFYFIFDINAKKFMNLKSGILLLVLTSIMPIYWYKITVDHYGSLVIMDIAYKISLQELLTYPAFVFHESFGLIFFLLLITGLIISFANKKTREYSFIVISYLLIFLYLWFIRKRYMLWDRYFLFLFVFLVPYGYYAIKIAAERSFSKDLVRMISIVFCCYLVIVNLGLVVDKRAIHPDDFKSCVEWLRRNVEDNDSIMVFDEGHIALALKSEAGIYHTNYQIRFEAKTYKKFVNELQRYNVDYLISIRNKIPESYIKRLYRDNIVQRGFIIGDYQILVINSE